MFKQFREINREGGKLLCSIYMYYVSNTNIPLFYYIVQSTICTLVISFSISKRFIFNYI